MNTSIDYMTTADGCRIRYCLRTAANRTRRGTFMVLSGRSEFLEKYNETMGELTQRGYDVYSFDWRGQGLSTRMLADRLKGYVRHYDDYLTDLSQFLQSVVIPAADPPFYLLAHSMGAHIGMRYMHDNASFFEKAVLTAPMIDLPMPTALKKMLGVYTAWMVNLGFGDRYVTGNRKYSPGDRSFKKNRLTGDRKRFEHMQQLQIQNPDLTLGGVTHRWLRETLRSIKVVNGRGFAGRITIPVLTLSAEKDTVVSNPAQTSFSSRLKHGQLVTLPGSMHEILIETDAVRTKFWDVFDDYML